MFYKKDCIAMLLAGGQGSRLYTLTQEIAKPAVPFGGKYRIIDFPLSNCINSGIDTVGVLTQYQPLVLNEYIGSGKPWDLDRENGGVHILPPYQTSEGSTWYTGTANAIYQNINFIERYRPDYVAILSGDHVYKMDYRRMLRFCRETEADVAIAVLEVEPQEASRFGIMNTRENGQIYEFEEKPENPKSNLASMGIYMFRWQKLREYLERDSQNPDSENDFGKNIIPMMLADGQKLMAYRFDGYWKDVGTIDSLWEANMDLLDPRLPLDLHDRSWKIYARNPVLPPHYIAPGALVQNAMITEGCTVEGNVDFSVLFAGVKIGKNAQVRDSIIMPNTVIEEGAVIEYAIVAENAVIGAGAHIGMRPEDCEDKENWGVAVIGSGTVIGPGETVAPKAIVHCAEVGR